MKAFADLTDDERTEWRSSPVTQAFIAWMRGEAEKAKEDAFTIVRSCEPDNDRRAVLYAGKAAAMEHATDVATRSFNE